MFVDEARGVVRLEGGGGVAELVAGAGSGEVNIISSTGEIFSAEKLVNSCTGLASVGL